MIIYVNYNKQTGEITVDQNYPRVPGCLEFSPNTIVDTEDSVSFEISFIEGIYMDSQGYAIQPQPPSEPAAPGIGE